MYAEMRCGNKPSESLCAGVTSTVIPADQLYRYAEHVTIHQCSKPADDVDGQHQETGFINDEGVCMDCEEVQGGN